MQPPEFVSLRRILYELHAVAVTLPGGGSIGPITWRLERARHVRVTCADDAQWLGLVALLSGQRAPSSGRLEEVVPVTVQTDVRVREKLDPNRTVAQFLESPDAPEHVWLEGRRRDMLVLVDLLGLSPALRRRPFKHLPPEVQERVWALHFMISRANLLMGRDLFRLTDPILREVLRRRWSDLSGTLVAAESAPPLPGPVDTWLRIAPDGSVSVTGVGEPVANATPEGR